MKARREAKGKAYMLLSPFFIGMGIKVLIEDGDAGLGWAFLAFGLLWSIPAVLWIIHLLMKRRLRGDEEELERRFFEQLRRRGLDEVARRKQEGPDAPAGPGSGGAQETPRKPLRPHDE
jgi:hypothetical protein